jgi:hypothetical protein
VKPKASYQASKHRPRGFESLEPRYALDGTTLPLPTLPTTISPMPVVLGMSVYAAPIGPVPVSANSAIASATSTTTSSPTTILPPISRAYLQQLNAAALPIGPARPTTLPAPLPALPAQPLYAEGALPANQTPANLPTTQQSLPVVTTPPGSPTFTLYPSRPLH